VLIEHPVPLAGLLRQQPSGSLIIYPFKGAAQG
jgi:hypothetical protein